jgi:hypothetical protein
MRTATTMEFRSSSLRFDTMRSQWEAVVSICYMSILYTDILIYCGVGEICA